MGPIEPEASTEEEPIEAHRIKLSLNEGLRLTPAIERGEIRPTPIATPPRLISGILEAKYLNPIKIIDNYVISKL